MQAVCGTQAGLLDADAVNFVPTLEILSQLGIVVMSRSSMLHRSAVLEDHRCDKADRSSFFDLTLIHSVSFLTIQHCHGCSGIPVAGFGLNCADDWLWLNIP